MNKGIILDAFALQKAYAFSEINISETTVHHQGQKNQNVVDQRHKIWVINSIKTRG